MEGGATHPFVRSSNFTFTHFPIVAAVSKIVYVDSISGLYLMHIKVLISNAMDSDVGGRGGDEVTGVEVLSKSVLESGSDKHTSWVIKQRPLPSHSAG